MYNNKLYIYYILYKPSKSMHQKENSGYAFFKTEDLFKPAEKCAYNSASFVSETMSVLIG